MSSSAPSRTYLVEWFWLGVTAGDETVFRLFDGEEADVRAASEQAGTPFERVLESAFIDGGRTEGQGR